MAYRRWSHSFWYAFWAIAEHGVTENADNAILEVMPYTRFEARQLRDDLERCVNDVVGCCSARGQKPSKKDLEDLRDAMREFIADVDDEYDDEYNTP